MRVHIRKPQNAQHTQRTIFLRALRTLRFLLIVTITLDERIGFTQPAQPPQPTFRTEANYVRVDVFPTKDGAPVLDLQQDDFELLEGGVPQKIEQFEHVAIRAAGPQDTRIEPTSVAESRQMAQNPRARVFVVFLDTYHVELTGSHNIRRPLVEALDHVIGPDDLVAVMTPEMSATDIAFARKTITIEGFLGRYWDWGERDRIIPIDPADAEYEMCYPGNGDVVSEMIARRHEKRTLDALDDLVQYLRGVREERKAILAVTDGWLLYRPNLNLMRPLSGQNVPSGPAIGIEPRGGKLTTKDTSANPSPNNRCEADRVNLAQIDDERDFRELLDRSNRANASFYPIDPRGLPAFDSPINAALPVDVDLARLRQRESTLRTLAGATDGLAIVASNDLGGGLRRAVADLSSYYLLGYYSTGKLDGRFHSITVHVKRPGVQVRARRGYLAATPGAAVTAARSPAVVGDPVDVEALATQAALGSLAEFQRELPLRVQAAAGWKRGPAAPVATFWIVADASGSASSGRDEVRLKADPTHENAGSGSSRTFDVSVIGASGATVGRASAPSGARSVLIPVSASEAAPGDYTVRVRSEAFGTATVRATLRAAPDTAGAIVMRRGPTTGNKDVPTADLRFRRNERVRVDIPVAGAIEMTARVLDRTGKPLAIPLAATARDEADGSRWQSTALTLAPLAPGDYLIEMAGGRDRTQRVLVAFRIVP